jgi:hypothetical protein
MFGHYTIPLELACEGISLSLEKDGESFIYTSSCAGVHVEKILLADRGEVLINPVEPMHKPKELTSSLLVEFEKPILVDPEARKRIFVTYPIEIGVFISTNTAVFEVLDVLTLALQKFTLYGNPRSGTICRYWKSNVYSSLPSMEPLHEGVIELRITNTTKEWVKVTKAVFSAYGMKMYYSTDLVAMKATMKIMHGGLAETGFIDAPLERGMKKSLELYTARKLPMVAIPKFVMEAGL